MTGLIINITMIYEIIIIIQFPKRGVSSASRPIRESEALGMYPLVRSRLTLGTVGKHKIEQKYGGRLVHTDQKSVCTTGKWKYGDQIKA